ncbi:hypothetical protein PR003_g2990 [Phytophthora rubi]|uniref:Uncharacterized protein n=1 Tax=Phytophthora rubi TaxID=129364 RepID=A0A6A3P392_9STRA|nr:hypothetical protein PR002_g2797 [Phytophthora rubi]KAE9049937.1 hypothetical protein PR001_g2851 [Phytophthora rubi]KAE9355168.1 hypothetical protein PR003_g2990 [Phytophthora rubi]
MARHLQRKLVHSIFRNRWDENIGLGFDRQRDGGDDHSVVGIVIQTLRSAWRCGYSFGKRHAERKVWIISHTPWLWDGEEFLRSTNYSTYG